MGLGLGRTLTLTLSPNPNPNPNPNQETEMLAPYLGGSEPTAKLDAAEKFLLDMCKVGRYRGDIGEIGEI